MLPWNSSVYLTFPSGYMWKGVNNNDNSIVPTVGPGTKCLFPDCVRKGSRQRLRGGKAVSFDCLPFLCSELGSMQLWPFSCLSSEEGETAHCTPARSASGLELRLDQQGAPQQTRSTSRVRPTLPHHMWLLEGKECCLRCHCFMLRLCKKYIHIYNY